MDAPTYIVIFASLSFIGFMVSLKMFRVSFVRARLVLFGVVWATWVITVVFGEFIYTSASATSCSRYIGCLTGFTGFDAFEHLVFGVASVFAIAVFSEYSQKYSVLPDIFWKKVLVIIALVVLLSVAWEIVECIHDAVRLDILHQSLRNIQLHINLLDQPSNIDTMGDLIFGLIGSIVGIFVAQSMTVTGVPRSAQ